MPLDLDLQLTDSDLRDIADADALAAFWARLGYSVERRVVQQPEDLGITAEGTRKAIRRIERMADHPDDPEFFQIYLFEVRSVTKTLIADLAQRFRDLQPDALLVLTSDWRGFDFVLLERIPQQDRALPLVRPHRLTLADRTRPDKVALRVLRRCSCTEPDGLAQHDKLRSAFDVAVWSEAWFNNRGLFSDYFLLHRLTDRQHPVWQGEIAPALHRIRGLAAHLRGRFAGADEAAIRAGFLEPMFEALGFTVTAGKAADSAAVEPDYLLGAAHAGAPLAAVLTYAWDRPLDGKDTLGRDPQTADENPGAVVVELLESGPTPWVIVTNGKLWRLYTRHVSGKAASYYEVDIEEALALGTGQETDLATAFRYFWLFFRADAFRLPDEADAPSFLDGLLDDSRSYAKALGESLKEKVFGEIFGELASGFVEAAPKGARTDDAALREVYQGTLTLMYRLLFLLYAEARDLLPVRETRDYYDLSLTRIKEEIAAAGGNDADARDARLAETFSPSSYNLWARLLDLFAVIDRGRDAVNVPPYNGGLFITDPAGVGGERHELDNARFLATRKISDLHLARALDRLSRDVDDKRHELVFVDYKSLGVRQLGSIYEGLLEFRLRVAEVDTAFVRGKKAEVATPLAELGEKDRLRAVRRGAVVPAGAVYLASDKGERRATGSYYTPDYIVKYIVEHTVGPVIEGKLEALRPTFREAQRWHAESKARAAATKDNTDKYDRGPAVEQKWGGLIDAFFDLRVLDPAMGSGHFLVETVDFITDRMLRFLTAFPWNPVTARLEATRQEILKELEGRRVSVDPKRLHDVNLLTRQVLKRCIYGVDLNPMAVELAKVSLWLHCFTLGAPLSFLNHHLRWGNSLVGVGVEEVREAVEGKVGGGSRAQMAMFGSRFTGLMLAADLMRHVGALPDITPGQVKASQGEYSRAAGELEPFKRLLDMYAAHWFQADSRTAKAVAGARDRALDVLRSALTEALTALPVDQLALPMSGAQIQQVLPTSPKDEVPVRRGLEALRIARERRFFHWELEFPEVFYGPAAGSTQRIMRLADGGFDAVVGNPPYVRQEGLGDDKAFFEQNHGAVYAGVADLLVYFFHRGLQVLRPDGRLGLVTSNKFMRAGYGRSLRTFLSGHDIRELIDFGDLPVFPDAAAYPLVSVIRKAPPGDELPRAYVMRDMAQAEAIEETMSVRGFALDRSALRPEGWSLERPEVIRLLDKIRAAGRPLREVVGGRFYRGVLTGFNEAFVIDQATRDRLVAEDPGSTEIIKPFLRGRDVKRWRVEWDGWYLIFTRRGINISKYPAVLRHLEQYREQLEPRPANWPESAPWPGRKAGTYAWYEIQDSIEYHEEFERPKIVYPDLATKPEFGLDDRGMILDCTLFMIPDPAPWMPAILNSPVVEFFFRSLGAVVRGGYLRFKSLYVEQVPIPTVDEKTGRRLSELVVELGANSASAEVEAELNAAVARLYGLDSADMELVNALM